MKKHIFGLFIACSLLFSFQAIAQTPKNSTPANTLLESSNLPKIDLNIVPYTYQEFENGFVVEIDLPQVDKIEALRSTTDNWIDIAIARSNEVKKLGREQNKEKPSSPQYTWISNYKELYNTTLEVTSLVATFYEFIGDIPGQEETYCILVKNNGEVVDALSVFTPSQVAFINDRLNAMVKSDIALPESDFDKKHYKNQKVDLSKAAVFFNEEDLVVQFATGEMNTPLGRPAIFNISVEDILTY